VLSTDEIAAIRREAEDWLPDWVTLTAMTEVNDGGEINVTPGTVWTGRGRLAPLMTTERTFADDVKAIADSVVTLPADCPVTERHRVLIRVAGSTTADQYEVVKVSSQHSLQLHVRAAVVRVR